MRGTRSLAVSLLTCTLTLAACGDQRSTAHSERANEFIANGQADMAMLELHTAFQLDPTNADYAQRIGELLLATGDAAEARFFLGEAKRLDPNRLDAAIRLASMQFAVSPEESLALIEDVATRAPQSAWGEIGRSEYALYRFDLKAALEHAELAVAAEPEHADAHWQVAISLTAMIQQDMVGSSDPPDERFQATLDAYDRFAEFAPARRWRAVAEKARIYTAWRGHQAEAEESLRAASELLGELRLLKPEFRILDRAIRYAQEHGNIALQEWALERKIERVPTHYAAWEELALLYLKSDRTASSVYKRLRQQFPDDSEPLLLHARHVRNKRGRRIAIRVLENYIKSGRGEAPPLLVEIAKNQYLLGKRRASLKTIAKLNRRFPDSKESLVMKAWGWLQSGRPSLTIEVLGEQSWTEDDIAAQRLLVDAYTRLSDHQNVTARLKHLLQLMPHPDLGTRQRYAQALFDSGEYGEARDAYSLLQRATKLQPDELARYGVSLYSTGAHAIGRATLEHGVDALDPSPIAVLGLFKHEGARERNRNRLRRGFLKLLRPDPTDPVVLAAYVRFETEAGTPGKALLPVEKYLRNARLKKQPIATALTMLASLQGASGNVEGARKNALEALDLAPAMPGVLEFAQAQYSTKAEATNAIRELTYKIDNGDQTAQRHALLGRLYYRAGNNVMARWSYEQALTGGLELPILKNDLAFLLAYQKRDLNRASVLARQAAQALPNQAGVFDTLGYVLLQLEDYPTAAEELRHGIEIATRQGSPQAELQYHFGLALIGLGRINEAESAFAHALALGEKFPDEAAARKQLGILRGEI